MRTLPAIALGAIAAAALAGAAIGASQKAHHMDVALPDGSVAHIEYYGDVAPKVTVAPRRAPRFGQWAPPGVPELGSVGRMINEMNRQMMRQLPGRPGAMSNVAAYGNMPAGGISRSITTVSDGQCTRTTEIVSEGNGKPPKVTSNASGNCGAAPVAPPPPRAPTPPPSAEPIDHT